MENEYIKTTYPIEIFVLLLLKVACHLWEITEKWVVVPLCITLESKLFDRKTNSNWFVIVLQHLMHWTFLEIFAWWISLYMNKKYIKTLHPFPSKDETTYPSSCFSSDFWVMMLTPYWIQSCHASLFFLFLNRKCFYTKYSDNGFPSLNSSKILPTHPDPCSPLKYKQTDKTILNIVTSFHSPQHISFLYLIIC